MNLNKDLNENEEKENSINSNEYSQKKKYIRRFKFKKKI